jgi:ABC-type antimicrobial peptide transport system permease subunit
MVNEVFANRFLKGVDPLRQQVVMDQLISGNQNSVPAVKWQIVGVFHNVKSRGSREDNPEIDVPFWQEAFSVSGIAIKTEQDPATMISSVAKAVNAVDPQAALALVRTMTQVHDGVLANDRFTAVLFASFAVVALSLTAVGIYGVMAFSVAQRSHEMAIRMALGATRRRVVSLVLREGLVLAAAGVSVGLVGSFFVGRTMQGILFSVGAVDLLTFSTVGFLSLIAALLALCLPATRAASVGVMRTLRGD